MMSAYWAEFLTIATIHLLAVASPGPDFAVVLRQSLIAGRSRALWTSAGVGVGILVHVVYSLLGLGILMAHSITAFNILKLVAVVYLIYLGFQLIRAKPGGVCIVETETGKQGSRSKDFYLGFLTNVLNPKATLFFVALFSVVIDPDTPAQVQAVYGIWMAFATALWFSLVALFFSQARVQKTFNRIGHWIDRVTGVALFALAGKIAVSEVN